MSRLRNALAVFGRATIWAPGAIPPDEMKYAGPLKRVALPAFDLLLMIGGYYAVVAGIPALDDLLPDEISNGLGLLFAACAVVCLMGAAFPRLWTFEVVGKILVVAILGMYFIALRTVDGGSPTRLFISTAVVWGMVLPVLRLWLVFGEYGARRNLKRQEAARKGH
jgi:hypothetical protein